MMKRNTLTYWVCTLLLSVCALPCLAQNRIEMYTYFPVPYVAYNNIFMVGTAEKPAEFQVGFTNNFALNLGSENKPSLTAHTVTLKPSNTLTFDTDVYTGTATFGTANTEGDAPYDAATLTFNNLRVGQLTETVNNGPDEDHGKVVEKITANNKVTVKGRVAMNTSAFTSADAAQLPDCSDGDKKVRWSKLKFGGQEHYFLTCGYTGSGGGDPEECTDKRWSSPSTAGVDCNIDSAAHYCELIQMNNNNMIIDILASSTCEVEGEYVSGQYFAVHTKDGADSACPEARDVDEGSLCFVFDKTNAIRQCEALGYGRHPATYADGGYINWSGNVVTDASLQWPEEKGVMVYRAECL